MYHYQLMLAKDWENQQAEQKNTPSTFRYTHSEFSSKRVVHFYHSGYDDIVKELVANPESCKDFYPVLQKVGLPYETYYQRIADKVAQTLQNALFERKVVLLPRVYNGSYSSNESPKASNNPSYYQQALKPQPIYKPDYSWITIDLVNHSPAPINIYDPADDTPISSPMTSNNEIFLRHAHFSNVDTILPKVHIFLGGMGYRANPELRGIKPLRVKSFAQSWLDELCALLTSGNSPFITKQNEALASQINHSFSNNIRVIEINRENCSRPDETIGYFFWLMLGLLNDTQFISPSQRMGNSSANESEGALPDERKLKQAVRALNLIKHSEEFDSSDNNYHNQELAKVASYYTTTPIATDSQGGENDYETKLIQLTATYFKCDNLTDIEALFVNGVKLLKYLREPGLIRYIETRREYKLKATKLDYQYIDIPPSRIRLDAEKLLKCANEVCEKHLYHDDIKAAFIDDITDFANDIVEQVENGSMSYAVGYQKIEEEEKSLWEQSLEWISRGLSILGGAGLIMAGIAMCTTGVGCIVGTYLAAHGANSVQEGFTGNDGFLKSVYQESAKQLGMSESVGSLAYDMIDLGLSVKGKLKLVPRLNEFGNPNFKLWHRGRQDLIRAYKNMNNWLLRAEIASDIISLNSVIEDVQNIIVFDKAAQETSIGISEPENIKNVGEIVDNCEYVILMTFEDNPKYKGYYHCTRPTSEQYKIYVEHPNYQPTGEGM